MIEIILAFLFSAAHAQTFCQATDVPTLNACVAQSNVVVEVQNNIVAASGSGCPVIIDIQNRNNVTINGNGYKLTRIGDQYNCSLMNISNSDDVTVNDFIFDENAAVVSCTIAQQQSNACPYTIPIRNSDRVTFDNVHVLNGKGYVVDVRGGTDFSFVNGRVENSGIIGIYIGGGIVGAQVLNSVIIDTEVNGIAVLNASNVLIQESYFENNHRNGKFDVDPVFGTGFTGGGQVYLAQGDNITFCRNDVINGGQTCPVNCQGGVHGVEFGLPNTQSLNNVVVQENDIQNHTGFNLLINSGTGITGASDTSNSTPSSCAALPQDGTPYKLNSDIVIDDSVGG